MTTVSNLCNDLISLFILCQVGVKNTVTLYPFMLHSLSMSIFSSVIGPFGGFFASGFKRAFKIKVGQLYLMIIFHAMSILF